jgi:phosphonoacetate hydrolase
LKSFCPRRFSPEKETAMSSLPAADNARCSTTPFTVGGRSYQPPATAVAVICIDGCGSEYLDVSMAHGRMPRTRELVARGYRGLVRAALPTFTNVNNAAIATGLPPAETGISGNFFLDPESGEEVMMNSKHYLRAETIFAAAAKAGRRVGIVTAKEKLRDLLSAGLALGSPDGGIAFSSEKADKAQIPTHGIDQVEALVGEQTPEIYSAEASLFALRAGVALLEQRRADFLYLSLTDYMQHKYPPEAAESLEFYAGLDREIGHLLDLGAVVGATADHGMNAKCDPAGEVNVLYLETELTERFGPNHRVICPITDPYVVHHGALGSLVMVHLAEGSDQKQIADWILARRGITEVYDRTTAAEKCELPADRIGDLVVLAGRDSVIGRTPADHDLSQLEGGLRSHGGRYEEMVPMLLSESLNEEYYALAGGDPRNFDIFQFTCNGVLR